LNDLKLDRLMQVAEIAAREATPLTLQEKEPDTAKWQANFNDLYDAIKTRITLDLVKK
jgi:hypothetical protein